MSDILKLLLTTAVVSSLMIFVVLIIRAFFRNKVSSMIITSLWLIVVFRMIFPIMIESPYHIDGLINVPIMKNDVIDIVDTENIIQSETIESSIDENIINVDSIDTNKIEKIKSSDDVLTAENHDSTDVIHYSSEKTSKKRFEIDLTIVLLIVWGLGFLFVLLSSIMSSIIFRNKVTRSHPVINKDVLDTLTKCKYALDIKKHITVLTWDKAPAPMLCSFFKPILLMPTEFAYYMEKEKIDCIILHEMYHVKRHDILFSYVWLVAKAINWFNPLVWIAYKIYQNDVELACDEMVTKRLDKQQALRYSQALIDAVRMSKARAQLMIGVSLMENQTTLKERVTRIINPTNKSKYALVITAFVTILIVIASFTTACMPDNQDSLEPDNSEVGLKQDLKQTVSTTKIEMVDKVDEENDEGGSRNFKYSENFSNDDDSIKINFDADIIIPNTDDIPVANIQKGFISQQVADNLIKELFGGVQLYNLEYLTKSDIEAAITRMTFAGKDLDSDLAKSKGITDLDVLQKEADRLIELYWERWEKAADTKEEINEINVNNNDYRPIGADLGKGEFATMMCGSEYFSFENFGYRTNWYPQMPQTAVIVDMENNPPKEAIDTEEKANALIDKVGIKDMKLTDIMYYDEIVEVFDSGTGEDISWYKNSGREYYVASFERTVGNMTIDRSFFEGTSFEGDPPEEILPYEMLDVWFRNGEIVQVLWVAPHEVTEITDDSVQIIDFEEAKDIIVNQAFDYYSDVLGWQDAGEIIVEVDRVELTLARVNGLTENEYKVIPVWDFYAKVKIGSFGKDGEYWYRNMPKTEDGYNLYGLTHLQTEPQQCIMTVNALDGSIINRMYGH